MKTYNVEEAAEYCKCHAETIREYIRAGKLIASKPGRGYCIQQAALDAFLNQLENERVQASLESRSEKKCLEQLKDCTYETAFGTSILNHPAVNALAAVLARKTGKPQRS